jgi:hypothetical protein
MSIIGLFTRTLSMIFRNAALWVVALSMLLIGTLFSRLVGGQNAFTLNLVGLVSMVIIAILVGAVVQIFNEIAEGRNPSIIDGFRAGWRKALPLVLLQLIWQVLPRLVSGIVNGNPQGAIGPAGSPEALSGSDLMFLVVGSSMSRGNILSTFLGEGSILLAILVVGAFAIGTDRAVVLEDLPVPAALAHGWNLLRGQFSSYVRIGLVAALVTLALGALMALAQSLVIGPAAFGAPASQAEIARLNASPFLAVALALNVVFNALILILLTGVWTLAFRHWQGKNSKPIHYSPNTFSDSVISG